MKFTSTPARNTPSASITVPLSRASMAAAGSSCDGSCTTVLNTAPLRIDATATGPTASARLVPSTAYNSGGSSAAYKPTWGGKPARKA